MDGIGPEDRSRVSDYYMLRNASRSAEPSKGLLPDQCSPAAYPTQCGPSQQPLLPSGFASELHARQQQEALIWQLPQEQQQQHLPQQQILLLSAATSAASAVGPSTQAPSLAANALVPPLAHRAPLDPDTPWPWRHAPARLHPSSGPLLLPHAAAGARPGGLVAALPAIPIDVSEDMLLDQELLAEIAAAPWPAYRPPGQSRSAPATAPALLAAAATAAARGGGPGLMLPPPLPPPPASAPLMHWLEGGYYGVGSGSSAATSLSLGSSSAAPSAGADPWAGCAVRVVPVDPVALGRQLLLPGQVAPQGPRAAAAAAQGAAAQRQAAGLGVAAAAAAAAAHPDAVAMAAEGVSVYSSDATSSGTPPTTSRHHHARPEPRGKRQRQRRRPPLPPPSRAAAVPAPAARVAGASSSGRSGDPPPPHAAGAGLAGGAEAAGGHRDDSTATSASNGSGGGDRAAPGGDGGGRSGGSSGTPCGPGEGGGAAPAACVPWDAIRLLFELTIDEAARALGASVSEVKRRCRAHGVVRWPQRKLVSLRRVADAARADAAVPEGKRQALLAQVALNRSLIMNDANAPLLPTLKAQRQNQYRRDFQRRSRGSVSTLPSDGAGGGGGLDPGGGSSSGQQLDAGGGGGQQLGGGGGGGQQLGGAGGGGGLDPGGGSSSGQQLDAGVSRRT